jgi:hypothetical protein
MGPPAGVIPQPTPGDEDDFQCRHSQKSNPAIFPLIGGALRWSRHGKAVLDQNPRNLPDFLDSFDF